ncbi:SRPBCC family protein [Amycolatopsis vancoresmycina]|uniref:Activator of HSP90 ATPase n=1 Tax=Amycolatopsis vancoresmycina DSM 44592 TaxID=1292037 RepID=R1IB21_9PSEU|nr:SRPBCC domain-containing protein [Amycolatopsis vancoresmycina]EOD67594.1 activator of HSP90 ATPase [Amycolatopsis vancoresmycina DSM 44592]
MDILHRIGIRNTTPADVYAALTTIDGLAGWWTEKTEGETGLGGVIAFRFIPGGFDMKVTELDPGRLVRWEVVDGPPEWIGTTIRWDIDQRDDHTIVLFKHEGWREAGEFMHHCSTKWAIYLMSLKQLAETGEGAPAPRDVMISDWH